MGDLAPDEIDSWLRKGGTVVTASERAARTLATRFHHTRRREGLTAWPAPQIHDWKSFIRKSCAELLLDGRLVLNPLQEQSIWADILQQNGLQAGLLEAPRYRLAAMAMSAHELLCSYAPQSLRTASRRAWQNDAEAFSRWLATFDDRCRTNKIISPARLPVELLAHLSNETSAADASGRPALLLAGFDRLLPIQRAIFDAWGDWHESQDGQPAAQISFYEAVDDQSELEACALFCKRKLADNPANRILVVTQDLHAGRGQVERVFLRANASSPTPVFEFSLGVSLSQVPLPRAAFLLLRWLSSTLAEHEMDWLFSSGYAAANPQESKALQARMRAVRRKSEQQPVWSLHEWLGRLTGNQDDNRALAAWASRVDRVRARVKELAGRSRTALDWAELVPHWLELLEFAAAQPLSSAEFQASSRWQQALESAGSLGFDGRQISWNDFLSLLGRAFDETVFALESRDAPIQITGPAESAVLTADAIWFLGATEDAWPAGGATHPLLPLEVQRETGMPHATPQLDWDLAQSMTTRLIASANEVHFSYPRQKASAEARPSRLVLQSSGHPLPLPAELTPSLAHAQRIESIQDFSRVPLQPGKVSGGASVLTFQSQCPFKAFAIARLGAENWEPAQAALTPAQRGQLLHAALHSAWGELRRGDRPLAEVLHLDRDSFASKHVHQAFQTALKQALINRMPMRYLKLEEERLTHLVAAWLEYESMRIEFEVLETEAKRTIALSGLSFDLRLDRIDRMNDGTLLVIDYKTGDVKPKVWELPRPEDIQLPLYAGFALDNDELLGGLVFAKIRPGELQFSGRVGAASTTLFSGLRGSHALLKNPLRAEHLFAWRENIEQLAKDFLAGRADVDPRDPPSTCERCGLQPLCRVHEDTIALDGDDDFDNRSGFAETADD
jgi:probable DNA repair protein